jgi:hypothetical protein
MIPGQGKYPIEAITDWDKEIKKHIPDDDKNIYTKELNYKDDFDEFVSSIISDSDLIVNTDSDTTMISSSTISGNTITITDGGHAGGLTMTHDLDLFSFYDNIETYEQKTERRLETIEKRLCILEPKKDVLEKYVVLQDLYKQYMAAEALLQGDDNDDNDEDLAH